MTVWKGSEPSVRDYEGLDQYDLRKEYSYRDFTVSAFTNPGFHENYDGPFSGAPTMAQAVRGMRFDFCPQYLVAARHFLDCSRRYCSYHWKERRNLNLIR